MAAVGAVATHADASTTQVFNDETFPGVVTQIDIGASASPQYDFYKNSDQVHFLSTNGGATINTQEFFAPGLPSPGEQYTSEPGGLQLTPSTNNSDVYYHLSFDIGSQAEIGYADFSPDTTELYSVTYTTSPAPEPATWAELLLGVGAAGLALRQVRSRRRAQVIA